MNCIIIEDEKPSARRLKNLLQEQGVNVENMLHSVSESREWFKNNIAPELLFVDIQLGDGLSFDIFEGLGISSAIIFTTAYDEYALKAFKLNSIDYLLKPIDSDELKQAINKYKNQQKSNLVDLSTLKNLISTNKPVYKSRFSVKVGAKIKICAVENITCFTSENKSTFLFTKEGRSYAIDDSLEVVFESLNPDSFYRVNRSCIVNINFIEDIISYSNSRLKLIISKYTSKDIIVSREKVSDFKNWIS